MGALGRVIRKLKPQPCSCCGMSQEEMVGKMMGQVADDDPMIAYDLPCGCTKEMLEPTRRCKIHAND